MVGLAGVIGNRVQGKQAFRSSTTERLPFGRGPSPTKTHSTSQAIECVSSFTLDSQRNETVIPRTRKKTILMRGVMQ